MSELQGHFSVQLEIITYQQPIEPNGCDITVPQGVGPLCKVA